MVECLQNIVKHGESYESGDGYEYNAVFMIGKKGEEYIIASGNPLYNDGIEGLRQRLDKVNSLDKDGLKQLYKDIIKNTSISEKGGAGLGFVDMARKSGKKLEYGFVEMDEERSFFSLKTTISR
jgi:hypothetical protein